MNKNELFEIQTVTHRANVISFTWTDLGSMYKVYRDEELLYEGTVAKFDDGDFKHAKMYNYSVEQVLDGKVVNVIGIQTTAFAEERNMENPLQFLVMTTIVAKTQIALSWEEIADVDEYEIYRNGEFMKIVKGNSYSDRHFSLDEAYVYRIHSKRPIAKSEEKLSGGKSIAATIVGLVKRPSFSEEPAIEKFTVSKLIAPAKRLLTPVMERPRLKNVDRWTFRYTTFLQDQFIKNPNILSANRYFQGDGRGFNMDGMTYRTRVTLEFDYGNQEKFLISTKEVGETVAYNYLRRIRKKKTASSEGIVLERTNHKKGEAGFLLTHAVGNPIVAAPAIDYEVRAVLRRDGTFDMTGHHDQAPHHEIYIVRGEKGELLPIHQAESKGLLWMSPVLATQYWRYSNFE